MRIGIICEGRTDDTVLRAILRELCKPKDLVFVPLQPPTDKLGNVGKGGWQGVRKFLGHPSSALSAAPLELIIIQVDADTRHDPAIAPHLTREEGDDDLDALCRHVKSWAKASLPDSVVIALPRETTDTWLLAAHSRRKNVETIENPARVLADAGCLRTENNKPLKSAADYEKLAVSLLVKLKDPGELHAIPELERFVGKVRARLRSISRDAKATAGQRR
jgi:hypothetical protein